MAKRNITGIYILEILRHYATKEDRMTQKEIMYYLERDYQIQVTRKTLSTYLNELKEAGYIKGQKGVYPIPVFDEKQWRVLFDGIVFGKYLTYQEANILIHQLKKFLPDSMQNHLNNVYYVENINRSENNRLFENIDRIDEAIEKEKKIKIISCIYDENGVLKPHKETIVDPYYLVTDKSRYYLICYAGRNHNVENRRLDRILHVEILSTNRMPIEEIREEYKNGFQLPKYMKEHLYMFSGPCSRIVLRVKKENIGDVIDWCGNQYDVLSKQEDTLEISFIACENAIYYWALQYGQVVEILRPESLRKRVKDGLKEMLQKYEEVDYK